MAGESACLELQVKNHSNKKVNTLFFTLSLRVRKDSEGVANLVFDVPKDVIGVQGGTLDGEGEEDGGQPRRTESLCEIRCQVQVKSGMGIGRYVIAKHFLNRVF